MYILIRYGNMDMAVAGHIYRKYGHRWLYLYRIQLYLGFSNMDFIIDSRTLAVFVFFKYIFFPYHNISIH